MEKPRIEHSTRTAKRRGGPSAARLLYSSNLAGLLRTRPVREDVSCAGIGAFRFLMLPDEEAVEEADEEADEKAEIEAEDPPARLSSSAISPITW